MHLLILGLNHTTAPLAVREKVAFAPEQVTAMVAQIRASLGAAASGEVAEAAVLSTCNRTEFWAAAENPQLASESLLDLIAQAKSVPRDELEQHTYVHLDAEAARHAFRVASGLDSMVLGETQIVGQMKRAEKLAREAGGLGLYLHHLFQSTFKAAKQVRTATEIGAHSVSMAAAAVRLAERLFGALSDRRILFVGAGEMIELCAAHFSARSPKSITIANRTVEKAQALAARYRAEAMRLADVPEAISRYDIIVSCTASSLPIIGLGMIQRAVRERRHSPIFIVDLAVPRDVESEVASLEDVYVYTVDDLSKVVQAGVAERRTAVAQAEVIIDGRVRDFRGWMESRAAVPAIRALLERADQLRRRELRLAQRALRGGASTADVLERLSRGLAAKLTHDAASTLRNAQGLTSEDRATVARTLERFYMGRGR